MISTQEQRVNKFSRLRERLTQPEWQRYGAALLFGKATGVMLVFCIMAFVTALVGTAAHAQSPTVQAADIVNPINTLWVLVAAFLVFGMQVGFTMLEAGFCRSRETVNVLMECVVDTCLCGILFYAWGFTFMFSAGAGMHGLIGTQWFFLLHAPATYETTGVSFLAYWLFQFAFADTCSTVTSGAMIGRTGWVGDLLYSVGVSGFIYPIIGHWAWGPDGLLALMGSAGNFLPQMGIGFHDFAGSTVVHTIGGTVALAGAIVLGPRLGRTFKRDGGGPMLPHDLVMATAGGLILWFGWYGFNPGSTLSAMDFNGCGRVAANTTLAACAGGLSAMFYGYPQTKKWDLGFTVNGFLAGLVAITCPCYWVSPGGAIVLGAVAGVIAVAGVNLLEWLRIDDPIGAVPVHMMAGIWGTLSLGLFACGHYAAATPTGPDTTPADMLTGLFYGGGITVLRAQVVGSLIMTSATFIVSYTMFFILNKFRVLRVTREGEIEGLDLHEHGVPAYPEYALIPSAVPAGAPAHFAAAPNTEEVKHPVGFGL